VHGGGESDDDKQEKKGEGDSKRESKKVPMPRQRAAKKAAKHVAVAAVPEAKVPLPLLHKVDACIEFEEREPKGGNYCRDCEQPISTNEPDPDTASLRCTTCFRPFCFACASAHRAKAGNPITPEHPQGQRKPPVPPSKVLPPSSPLPHLLSPL
jgi:hypothetical protein